MLKKALIVLAVLIAGPFVTFYTLFLLLPPDMAVLWAAKEVRKEGVDAKVIGAARAFPLGYRAERVLMTGPQGAGPVVLTDASAVLVPGELFGGRLAFAVEGRLGGGRVFGKVSLAPSAAFVDLKAEGVSPESILASSGAMFSIPGTFEGSAKVRIPRGGCPEGAIRADGASTDGEVKFSGFALPVGRVTDSGLEVELSGCKALVKGAWIEGGMLSARVTGTVTLASPPEASPLELLVEVIPGPGARGEPALVLLSPYRKSASYYSFSVRGTPARPVVSP